MSAIDWYKVKEDEMKRQGYDQQDIDLLRAIDSHTLTQDMAEHYLKHYIHSKTIGKSTLNTKLIRQDGEEYGLSQVEFCPHCRKMICPGILDGMFECNFCHHCGGKVEY